MATKALLHPVGSLEARLSGLEGGLHRMCQLTSGAWLPLSQSLASYGLYASRTIHDQFTTLNGQAPANSQVSKFVSHGPSSCLAWHRLVAGN